MDERMVRTENDCIIRATIDRLTSEFILIFKAVFPHPVALFTMYDPLLHLPLGKKLFTRFSNQAPGSISPFRDRFQANLYQIRRLFQQLYGHRPDWESQFWLLVEEMMDMYEQRPEDLREVDAQREQDPYWLMSEKWVGMMMYVDRFSGDLSGFLKKLPYLEELGVNWVHLMPLLQSPPGSNDGGYAVSDYRAVDPRFGSMDDLKELLRHLRQKGMISTLDLVMNHTSDQHEWAQKARAGEKEFQDFYYVFDNRDLPDQYERTMPEIFPHSSPGNFTYVKELEAYVMSVFHHYQWDLNYANPAVLREMLKVLLFLTNLGVDVLRLDAVAFTWKQIGTSCQNLPQAHTILQLLKACAQVVAPGTAFIAEAIVAPREVVRYFGEGEAWGKECEIAYHATFMASLWDALATQEVSLLTKSLASIPAKPDRTTWINYLRCHDDIGLGFDEVHLWELGKEPAAHKQYLVDYYSGRFPGSLAKGAPFAANPKTGDARISGSMAALVGLEAAVESQNDTLIDQAIQKILMAHAIILAYGGLPLLYYGDEIGTGNQYDYLHDPDQAYDNRWMHRPMMNWEKARNREKNGTVEQQIFDGIKRLIHLRQGSPELADRNSCSLEASGNSHVFSFLRWNNEGARTMVLANFSPIEQQIDPMLLRSCGMSPDELIDKITGRRLATKKGRIILPGLTTSWLTECSTFDAFQKARSVQIIQNQGIWPKN